MKLVQVDRRVRTVPGMSLVWGAVALFALGAMLGFMAGRI